MRRRLWVLLLALPVLLLIGDVVYWRFAVRQLQAGYQAWIHQRQAAGWKTTVGQTAEGGWPLSATLTITGLALQGGAPDIIEGVRWSADRITLRSDLWHPTALVISVAGEQRLGVGPGPDLPVTADRLDATLGLHLGEVPHAVDLVARNLRAGPGDPANTLTVGLLQTHVTLDPSPAQDHPSAAFSVSAEAIGLPQAVKWPLGPILSSFTIDGSLIGAMPLGHGLTQAATAWRDAGGSLEIQHLALGWGPLGLTASATLALDDQLQPMGAGTSRIIGYAATLDALAKNGVLSRSAVVAAKAVLSLLAGSPDDNAPSEVDVPLTLQYRTLSMRQVPLVRLPELDWPTP
jgi:hypothetical protein